jgi:hypothetical protein
MQEMTPEAATELDRIFSGPPDPPGKSRYHHMLYDLVRLDDDNGSGSLRLPYVSGPTSDFQC